MYRYTSYEYEPFELNFLNSIHIKLELKTYNVIKTTKFGVRIDDFSDKGRFINLSSRKQWACETKEKALESFLFRKYRQLKLLENQLNHTKEAIRLAEKLRETE
jgi:hypothetical protein